MKCKDVYEFGKFRLDPANHRLLSGETPVALTPKVFEILLVLVQEFLIIKDGVSTWLIKMETFIGKIFP